MKKLRSEKLRADFPFPRENRERGNRALAIVL